MPGFGAIGNAAGLDAVADALRQMIADRLKEKQREDALKQQEIENQRSDRSFGLQERQFDSLDAQRKGIEEQNKLTRETQARDRAALEENRVRDDAARTMGEIPPDSELDPSAFAKIRAFAAPGTFKDEGAFQPEGPSRDTASGIVPPMPEKVRWIGTAAQLEKRKADERAEKAAADAAKRGDETTRHNQAMEALGGQRIEVSTSNRNTLTPQQEIAAVRGLRNDYNQLAKPAREMQRQLGVMEEGMKAARAGQLAAGSQAVLVTFQKILDPTSVVRESEYARSGAGQSLLNRIQGAYDRLAKGGAGVPLTELENFANLAREMTRQQAQYAQSQRKTFEKTAIKHGLDPSEIFGDEGDSGGGAVTPKTLEDLQKMFPGATIKKVG